MNFPQIIRKINKKTLWTKQPSWVLAGHITADIFREILTTNGKLSVWLVNNNDEITQVCAAITCTRQSLQSLEFAATEYSILDTAGFEFDDDVGETPYGVANTLHRNLYNLSTHKLSDLAMILCRDKQNFNRVDSDDIQVSILDAVRRHDIQRDSIKIETPSFLALLNEIPPQLR